VAPGPVRHRGRAKADGRHVTAVVGAASSARKLRCTTGSIGGEVGVEGLRRSPLLPTHLRSAERPTHSLSHRRLGGAHIGTSGALFGVTRRT